MISEVYRVIINIHKPIMTLRGVDHVGFDVTSGHQWSTSTVNLPLCPGVSAPQWQVRRAKRAGYFLASAAHCPGLCHLHAECMLT